jgi:hypothetical protein
MFCRILWVSAPSVLEEGSDLSHLYTVSISRAAVLTGKVLSINNDVLSYSPEDAYTV